MLQERIQQVAKEYLEYKAILDERIKTAEKNKEEFAKNISEIENTELFLSKYFDTFGAVQSLAVDTNQMKIKLYHYITLADDLIEIPQDIKKLVEDYKPTYTFSKNGEIVDKELYNRYKQDYITMNKQFLEKNNLGME